MGRNRGGSQRGGRSKQTGLSKHRGGRGKRVNRKNMENTDGTVVGTSLGDGSVEAAGLLKMEMV